MQYLNSKFFNFTLSFLILIFAFYNFPSAVFAEEDVNQKILDLRAKVEELTKLAQQYRTTVQQKQKEANTLKRQIDVLNNQILRLETEIDISENNIESVKLEINNFQEKIFDTTQSMEQHRGTVGEIMQYMYQRDRMDFVATLLASERFSDFMDQAQQMENLNGRLTALLKNLRVQKNLMEQNVAKFNEKKSLLETLNKKQITQRATLASNKVYKDKLFANTRGEETRYQQLLAETERKEAQFFAELKSYEFQALKDGAFIVHVTASNVPARGTKIFQYPFSEYYLTQGYGMTRYAKRGAYGGAPHNGIDIDSGVGESIHPIGPGAVLASSYNNGFGNWVAVRHPNDLVSLYAHMQSPSGLTNGTAVDTSSVLGYEGNTGNSTGPHLHLTLYKEFFTYISPKNNQLYFNYFEGTLNPLDYL